MSSHFASQPLLTSVAAFKCARPIRAACDPRRIVLFGLRARGQAGPASDVDLLVVLDRIENRRRTTVALRRLLADLPLAKDLVLTTPEEIAARGNLRPHYPTSKRAE